MSQAELKIACRKSLAIMWITILAVSEESEKNKDRLFVGSVEKAFSVLEVFGPDRLDLGLVDIMSRTGLNKSAAQRFTHTLHLLGYLKKDEVSRRYSLSKKVLESANSFLSVDTLVNRATPHIIDLRRQLDMRVGLGCLNGDSAMYLIPLQSNLAAFRTAHPGFEVPIFCTSTGRVLLAYRQGDDVLGIIKNCNRKKYTPFTIIDIDEIMTEIELVRQNGYAITEQELITADINIAAPVFDSQGHAIATVTASGSKSKWTRNDLTSKIAVLVMETARAISSTT